MRLVYYSHIFSILFLLLFFSMLFNGIFFWWIWIFLVLAPVSYVPVVVYRRPAPKKEENFSLVEQKEVKSFYDNVIQF